MKEIHEELRNAILSAIPSSNLVLFYAPLIGSGTTIPCRVSSANNGTGTNLKWKTLKSGLVVPDFDGTAYIRNATANWRSADSQGAILVLFRCTSVTVDRTLLGSPDEATGDDYLHFSIAPTTGLLRVAQVDHGGNLNLVTGATNVGDSKWHTGALISTGTAWSILLDGVAETLTVAQGANNGDWFADTVNRDCIYVGANKAPTLAALLIGQIGLVAVYSAAPTTAEILRASNRLKSLVP